MSSPQLIQAAPETLLTLRAALLTRPDLDTVFSLRDAGYAGGDALYTAFESYVQTLDQSDPQTLDVETFFTRAGEFLTQCGWGYTSFAAHGDSFCSIQISDCWEASPEHQPDPRGCHLTVGLLGAFLGKFAEYPVSVLEIEGPSTGTTECQFLVGNVELVADYYATHS